ncbi:MAG: Ig-like domain-containing protein, partial [Ilumatobacteraceae bacterium]|nr:Ig-like domain-containing protein [Ilumatobacteraceae bacterium]
MVELYEMVELCHAIEGCNWYPSLADRVSSDAAGAFVLDAVRYRDQSVPLQNAGFTLRAVDPRTGHESLLTARLPGDGRVRALTIAMTGRGDVVGTLRRDDGTPLRDPLVVARSIAAPSEGAQAEPDAAGRFRLEDLPVGAVQIVATDGASFTSATVHIPTPGAEAEVDLLLLTLDRPLAAVAGSVTDGATAQPAPGLEVFVTPAGYAGPTHVATTDAEGRFAVEGVPPGVARFKAWSPALGRVVGEAVAELSGDAVTTVEIVLGVGAAGSIRGSVRLVTGGGESALAGAYVVARSHGVFTLSDGEGRYELPDLALGRVELEVWDPVSAASTTRAVDLTADGQVLVLDFVLREDQGLGSVTVNLADGNGAPIAGADAAIGRFGTALSARTGADGSARISGVPPGRHEVLVRLGVRLARGQIEVLYPGHAAATDIVLGGLVNASIRVQAEQTGGGASGVLTPIAYRVPGVTSGGQIGQIPEEGWTPCELESDGRCLVEGLPSNVGSLVATATSGFYGSVTAAMWIDGVPDRELVISFEAPGVIAGRVVARSEDGMQAVEGAVVELWTSTPTGGLVAQSQVTTAGDGAFRFELVTPGRFSLRVYHSNHGVGWLDALVAPGQVIDDLELVPRGRAAVEGEVSLCYAKSHAKAGQQVRIALRPANVPRPFISDLEIDDLADRFLDRSLDADDRASFAFAGMMVGGWNLSATSAVNGSAWEAVSVGPAGATTILAETICLHPTGSISGTVALPESGAPAPSVTVQLFRAGSPPVHLATETTREDGAYVFADIPVGFEYQVRAFDAATNRGGLSRWARLCDASDPQYGGGCARDAVLDVSLAPMGRLTGVLRDQDELPVASAHVRLQTSVVLNQRGEVQSFQREWVSYTGFDGSFSFEGVPAGTAMITAFDPSSPLFVERSVAVDPVASPSTSADLELPATADVTVRVVGPAGGNLGADEPVIVFRQESSTYFREPSGAAPRVDHVAVNATASFADVAADRYRVGACLGSCAGFGVDQILGHGFISALGAAGERRMPDPPADQVVELELVGRATVGVTVTQAGEPVEDATVRITGSSFYGPRDVSTTTGAGGAITPIAGLGVGRYTVTAVKAGLGGSREIEIAQAQHGDTIELEIPIELSASADGVVLDPSGQPAVAALVTMSFDGRSFQALSGGDGAFEFPVLSAGHTYELEAYAADGLGRHSLRGIVVGTEPLHLGEILLDELNPWVPATAPVNGAQDADPSGDVLVDFSELMRSASLVGGRIVLREQGSGNPVATVPSVETVPDPDGEGPLVPFTRVRLAHAPLGSERLYLIEISKQVEDLAGRRPAFDFHAAFRTRDVVPPQVLGAKPAHDPEGLSPVGPDVVPVVTCSEPMDSGSLTPETVRLLDAAGGAVEAVLDLQRDGFDIRIRPLAALELDGFYTVQIEGAADLAGNPLAVPFSSTFRVRDLEPPVVTLLPPLEAVVDGDAWTALEGRPLTLRAAVASNDALRTVVLGSGGVHGAAALDPGGEHRRAVVAPTGVSEIVISAQAEDVSGNLATPASHVLRLVDDQPPTGVLLASPAAEVLPNHFLTVTVDLADDHGLRIAELAVAGAIEQAWTISLSGQAQSETRELRIPVDAAAGALVTVSCEVEDSLGQRTVLDPATLSVAPDLEPPVLTRIAPAAGSSFR